MRINADEIAAPRFRSVNWLDVVCTCMFNGVREKLQAISIEKSNRYRFFFFVLLCEDSTTLAFLINPFKGTIGWNADTISVSARNEKINYILTGRAFDTFLIFLRVIFYLKILKLIKNTSWVIIWVWFYCMCDRLREEQEHIVKIEKLKHLFLPPYFHAVYMSEICVTWANKFHKFLTFLLVKE